MAIGIPHQWMDMPSIFPLVKASYQEIFFSKKNISEAISPYKNVHLPSAFLQWKTLYCTKIQPFFCLQQEHLCTCGFNILIAFVKCQEGIHCCTRCTVYIMKFKKNSSRKGQNAKYALNYCRIRARKDRWQSVLGNVILKTPLFLHFPQLSFFFL